MPSSLPRPWFVAACVLCAIVPAARGAEAAFSADGREICLLEERDGEAREVRIGPSPTSARRVPLPAGVEGKVIAVASSAQEGWLLLTGDAVWRRSPGQAEFKLWLRRRRTVPWNDLAVDPTTGNLLLSGGDRDHAFTDLHVRSEQRARRVVMRRTAGAVGFVFASDGKVFFSYRGDLWGGEIELDQFESDIPTSGLASLTAERIAPLGDLETTNGTSASTGVVGVAATRTHLYVHLKRLGGSGWGWVARLPRLGSRAVVPDEARALEESWRGMSGRLAAAEILGPSERKPCLAASLDGRVMYRLDKPDKFLLHRRPDGPAEPWDR